MLPIILLSHGSGARDKFLDGYIKREGILPFNVFIYEPEKKEFTIGQVRTVKALTVIVPSARRLVILKDFDTAAAEAQNALLKTLEEKTTSNQFILCVTNTERILPTIVSRSKVVELKDNGDEEITSQFDALFDSLTSGRPVSVLGNPLIQSMNAEKASAFFDGAIVYLRSRLRAYPAAARLMKKALFLKKYLRSNNLNPQLAVDSFLLYWQKLSGG